MFYFTFEYITLLYKHINTIQETMTTILTDHRKTNIKFEDWYIITKRQKVKTAVKKTSVSKNRHLFEIVSFSKTDW